MSDKPGKPPFTTRRGFVLGTGFGVLALYGVWAANGAAPLPMFHSDAGETPSAGGHDGHGGGANGMSPEEFRRLTEAFIAANLLPDGSVRPGLALPDMPMDKDKPLVMPMPSPAMERAGHLPVSAPPVTNAHAAHGAHGGHGAGPEMAAPDRDPVTAAAPGADSHGAAAVDVYLLAHQWGYLPAVLRLQTGVRYRFRMMAEDVSHGAALQLGPASHIVRLRARTLVEQQVQFTSPGEYLLYCTVYCGMAHDRMQGKIIVAAASRGESK